MQDEVSATALTNARERAAKTLATTGMKIDSVFAISPVTFPEIQQKSLDLIKTAWLPWREVQNQIRRNTGSRLLP